eukprot:6178485-Pleurochrysis_carterae.AAC.1
MLFSGVPTSYQLFRSKCARAFPLSLNAFLLYTLNLPDRYKPASELARRLITLYHAQLAVAGRMVRLLISPPSRELNNPLAVTPCRGAWSVRPSLAQCRRLT